MKELDEFDQIIRQAKHPAPAMTPTKTEQGHWRIEVPGTGTGGKQVFLSPSLEGLCIKLAGSVWHGTNFIRHQSQVIRDINGTEAENDAEARFRARQARGEYFDDL